MTMRKSEVDGCIGTREESEVPLQANKDAAMIAGETPHPS